MRLEAARVYDDGVTDKPRTHVLIIGVGSYIHGDDGRDPTSVCSGLASLTSPPKSAMAVAEWFSTEFDHPDHPLGTMTMLASADAPVRFPTLGCERELPEANWENLCRCLADWKDAFQGHPDNMIVFYFCGHGISLGQKAAALLSDFGNDGNAYEPAIDIDALLGTMRNARPKKQMFIFDCCRTRADSLYKDEARIGGRALSIAPNYASVAKQCAIFPSIDGQKAFGLPDGISVFTSCFLDAVRYAGFDDNTGKWMSTTGLILNAIDRLVSCRLHSDMLGRTVPTAINTAIFEFNQIADPELARSVVTIDPSVPWPNAVFTASCVNNTTLATQERPSSRDDPYRCCVFEVEFGKWEFGGEAATRSLRILPTQRAVTRPVAYVKLEVTP